MKRVFIILVAGILAVAHGSDSVRAIEQSAHVPYGHPDFVPTPARPLGFRGKWGGSYPGATPPREWSDIYNVIWRQPVGMGEASPIVVGNKLLIQTTAFLYCIGEK